ncbi:hypothetical protein HNQ51_001708 [Inhella inkyongensis]|uniref:Uncharacterized protein n=1 Tax=Inhella inkyongensis TaxID=392593 RepID=A0A840S6I1_9BURK|nr:hypothetical protein [Inhella inkyongensis]MBB5204394.1 hypothetical protein [Inhella inkyongensis]
MSDNLYVGLKALLAGPSLLWGEVIATDGELATVELPDGGRLQARGQATVGQKVFVRGSLIESGAPDLPFTQIDL